MAFHVLATCEGNEFALKEDAYYIRLDGISMYPKARSHPVGEYQFGGSTKVA